MIVSDYSKIEEQERIWHRRHAVWRAHRAGATFTEIARVLGVMDATASKMYRKADREASRNERSPLTSELLRVEVVREPQWCAALGIRTKAQAAYRDARKLREAPKHQTFIFNGSVGQRDAEVAWARTLGVTVLELRDMEVTELFRRMWKVKDAEIMELKARIDELVRQRANFSLFPMPFHDSREGE